MVPLLFLLGMRLRLENKTKQWYGGHRQNCGKLCSLEMNFLSRSCSCIKDIFVLTSNFIYLLILDTNCVTHSLSLKWKPFHEA